MSPVRRCCPAGFTGPVHGISLYVRVVAKKKKCKLLLPQGQVSSVSSLDFTELPSLQQVQFGSHLCCRHNLH